MHFFDKDKIPVKVFSDKDEWEVSPALFNVTSRCCIYLYIVLYLIYLVLHAYDLRTGVSHVGNIYQRVSKEGRFSSGVFAPLLSGKR